MRVDARTQGCLSRSPVSPPPCPPRSPLKPEYRQRCDCSPSWCVAGLPALLPPACFALSQPLRLQATPLARLPATMYSAA